MVGDALLEAGEPRGELISLQLGRRGREVIFNQSVPRWFVTEWAKNPAIRHLRSFRINQPFTLRVVRSPDGWRITRDNRTAVSFKVKRAFKAGLPASEVFDFPPDP